MPDFLKRSLIQDLRERGIVVEFSRLRLHWVRGLVAEDVRVGDTNMFDQPSLSLNQLQLRLDYRALLRRQLEIKEVILRQGKLVWPITATNTLTLDNIQSELRFGENDVWSLDRFQADFAGAAFTLSGDIVHGSEIRNWEILRGGKSTGVANWRERLNTLYDVLQEIHFPHAPQLSLVVNGDARNFHSFIVWLNVMAPAVQTPWFDSQDFQFASTLTVPASAPTNFDSAWGFWTNAQPFRLSWNARFAKLKTKGLDVNSFACGGFWQAPELTVTNLSAELGGGHDEAQARLNVATRQLTFTNSACFDFHALAGLLTEKAQTAVRKATWRQSPLLQVDGSLVLPAWTNQRPDWQGEVPPKLQLSGSLAVTNFAFEKLALDLARADFSYSNRIWQLSDFWLAQAKTVLWLDGGVDERTKNYNCRVRGAFDPTAIRPFLTASNEVHGLNQFKVTEPVALDVTVNGRWPDFDNIDASGRVALTNFAVRGQSIDNVAGALHYTNRVLKFFHPQLWREDGTQTMKADEITLDFRKLEIFFTNGFSTADPEAVARAIGPKTGELMEPYRFLQPPSVRVNGCSPMR
ncbi:MAG TPA: hypothetical protein VHG71_03185, partial [Verrucomicrobiae bacterium]|nr:hypothetical protein [Verrucomicrobiae bacterium]